MITRKEYMKDSSNLHHKYYAQFVTEATKDFVLRKFGINKLKSSKDPHLNDLCKISHNGAGSWTWDFSPIDLKLAREAGEVGQTSLPSKGTCTCIGKAAARMLLEESL